MCAIVIQSYFLRTLIIKEIPVVSVIPEESLTLMKIFHSGIFLQFWNPSAFVGFFKLKDEVTKNIQKEFEEWNLIINIPHFIPQLNKV